MYKAVFATVFLFGSTVAAQHGPHFEVDPTWPKPLPKGWINAQVGGNCVDSHDHSIIVDRRDITEEEVETSVATPPIMMFDLDGHLIASWGDPERCRTPFTDVRSMPMTTSGWRATAMGSSKSTAIPASCSCRSVPVASSIRTTARSMAKHRTRATSGSSIPPRWRSIRITGISMWRTVTAIVVSPCSMHADVLAPVGPAGNAGRHRRRHRWCLRPGAPLHCHQQRWARLCVRPTRGSRSSVRQDGQLRPQHLDQNGNT